MPWGFLGVLPLFWAVEASVSRLDDSYLPVTTRSWKFAYAAAANEARGRDVLYLGDSQAKMGLLPAIVTRENGLSGYNLAALRGMPASSYAILKRALDSGARPKAIVVDFNPGLLQTPVRLNGFLWPRVLGPGDAWRLATTRVDLALTAHMIVGWLVPSWEARSGLNASLIDALNGHESESARQAHEQGATWARNDGAQPVPQNPQFVDETTPDSAGREGRGWRCMPANAVFVDRLISLAESHGVRVYWVIPPVSPALQAKRYRVGLEKVYDQFAESVRRTHPGLTVIDGRGLGFGREYFVDPVHFSVVGAEDFSRRVARVISRDLVGDPDTEKWVRLEPGTSRSPSSSDTPVIGSSSTSQAPRR